MPVFGRIVASEVLAVQVGLQAGVVPPGPRVVHSTVADEPVVVSVERGELHAVVQSQAVGWKEIER